MQAGDTLIICDTVPVLVQVVKMGTPHIQLKGIIYSDRLKGDIRVPVALQQAV